MIDGNKVLGLIPARGGSKGIPRKNIRPLGGKSLIAWTIDEARKSKYIDRLVVSTDDDEIADTARKLGAEVPFMRPTELASDTASGIDVVRHALQELPNYDAVVLLQPTSPFRSVEDIDGAIRMWEEIGCTVVGVTEATISPYWMFTINEEGCLKGLLKKPIGVNNRQGLPKAYALNGALYVANQEEIVRHNSFVSTKTRAYIMPRERSLDIDDEIDWEYAEQRIKKFYFSKE